MQLHFTHTVLSLWTLFTVGNGPTSCFHKSSSIERLAACFERFTVGPNFYNKLTYEEAQPTVEQRAAWSDVVTKLLDLDGTCDIVVPPSLVKHYAVQEFDRYCILYEKTTSKGVFYKGWGFMIVPVDQVDVLRDVHISAPHPLYDTVTVAQAASIFAKTGSRSLFVAGRIRTALSDSSDCVTPNSPRLTYYKTDPAHNDHEPFFDANIAIYERQMKHFKCSSSSCAFIQIHAKGRFTCTQDTVFLSSGIGNSSESKAWYEDEIDRPIKRLHRNLKHVFPTWNISLPSESNCTLIATKNVVGRVMNGVDPLNVCTTAAHAASASGMFIHAEQALEARHKDQYHGWARAIIASFPEKRVDLRTEPF